MAKDDEIAVRIRLKERLKFSRDARSARKDVEGIGDGAKGAEKKMRGFNTSMSASGNIMKIVKPAALITGLGLLAQAASAATAGVVALTAGLAPAIGILATMPAIGGAVAGGMIVTKLAMNGVTDALGGLHAEIDKDKLAKLTPAARDLVVHLDKLKAPIIELQRRAQKGLFPGLLKSLHLLTPQFKGMGGWVERVGKTLGNLAFHASKVGLQFKSGIGALGSDSIIILRNLGMAGINLGAALMQITLAARPLTLWLARGIKDWSTQVAVWANARRESGALAGFFAKTKESLQLLGGILGPFSRALGRIFGAGYESGSSLLLMLGQASQKFSNWTASASGQNTIKKWFDDAKAPVIALGGLISSVTTEFFKLGQDSSKDLTSLITMVDKKLVPAFADLAKQTTKALGKPLINGIENIALLFTDLAGTSGPLTLLITAIGKAAGALHKMFEDNPKILTATVYAFGLLSVMKVIAFVGKQIAGSMVWTAVSASFKYLKAQCLLTRIQLGLLWAQQKASAAWAATVGAARWIADTALLVKWKAQVVLSWGVEKAAAAWRAGAGAASMLAMRAQIGLTLAVEKAASAWRAGAGVASMLALKAQIIAVTVQERARAATTVIATAATRAAGIAARVGAAAMRILGIAIRFAMGPWGLLISAIVIGAVLIYKNWDTIKAKAGALKDGIVAKVGLLVGWFKKLPGRLAAAASGMWDFLKDGFRGAINFVIGGLKNLDLSIGPVDFAGKEIIPRITLRPFENIPMLATGGMVRSPGTVMVGEAGPEFLTLPTGARVDPLPDLPAINMSAMSGGMTKLFAKLVLPDGRVLADLVANEIATAKARG